MNNHISNATEVITWAQDVLSIEKQALDVFSSRIGNEFINAVAIIEARIPSGKVAVLGMGKSGHIANKIAATLASTGTPAFFVHPAEAGHGDLGMISQNDVVIAISQSGTSDELLRLLPYFKRYGIPLIALTGKQISPLAEYADVVIDTSVTQEACPHGLAPTASTIVALAAGDALAICLLRKSGFMAEDFAERHPHGALGRKLLVRVSDLMIKGNDIPKVQKGTSIIESLVQMTQGTVGAVAVIDEHNYVQGVFTDGDLRRALVHGVHIMTEPIEKFMTIQPKIIRAEKLAVEAVTIMDQFKVNLLLVTSAENTLEGMLNMRMLIHADVV
jgi:arabinose-5-phosphate isomerase